jgi:hypothetical protein
MINSLWLLLRLPFLTLIRSPSGPTVAGCPIFPADNIWNTAIDTLPLDDHSSAYISTLGSAVGLHPDFGSGLWDGGPIGIPYLVVPADEPLAQVVYTAYGDESDEGPFPIPAGAAIEGGSDSDGDRHVLVVQQGTCHLYELYRAFPDQKLWQADSGADYDLASNALRQAGWTSADAAGLPIFPGLVRYDEVTSGEIHHALRMTAPETQAAYQWPARHAASDRTGQEFPPMGARFRLRANFPVESFSPQVQVILRAIQHYGLILADNGSSWYISGAPDERWDNDILRELGQVHGSDFEAVNVSSLQVSENSGQVRKARRLLVL